MSTLTDRIRSLAERAPSESAFARQCGISKQLMRRYIHEAVTPGPTKLMAIAKGGGVSLQWLLTGGAPEPPSEGRETEPQVLPSAPRQSEVELVRAEDIPIRRFVSFIESVWDEPDAAVWLRRELNVFERRFFERFPELEKKWETQRSGDGVA